MADSTTTRLIIQGALTRAQYDALEQELGRSIDDWEDDRPTFDNHELVPEGVSWAYFVQAKYEWDNLVEIYDAETDSLSVQTMDADHKTFLLPFDAPARDRASCANWLKVLRRIEQGPEFIS